MSSISNTANPKPDTVKPSAAEVAAETVHRHLRKTASFIRLMDTLGLVFAWLAAVLLLWLLACVIDHWLLPLPQFLRWSFWLLGFAGTAVWLCLYLLPLLFRRINLTYAAQRIEHLVPEFKNGLISWLELEHLPDNGVPRGVMAALAFRAKRFIGDQDPSATVDTSPLIKLIGLVLLLSITMVVYTMISPKSVGATGKRILMPWSSLASPSRVEILDVQPGSVELTQGRPLELNVEVRGLRRDEPVFVRYSTTDGQIVDRVQELGAVTEGFRYSAAVTTDGSGVEQELDYWVEAGDARQGPFRVRLNPLPTVMLENVELRYPQYTGLPSRVVEGSGLVEAVEGTQAIIRARGNQAMKRAVLEINPELDQQQELIRAAAKRTMQVEGLQMTGELLLELNDSKDNPTKVEYRIRGYNERSEANPSPIVHSMSVIADLPPEVNLVGPESRLLRITPTSVVDIEVRASDPDFGLSKLKLQVRKNRAVVGETTLIDDSGLQGQQVRTTKLDVSRLGAAIGDRIQVLAAAQDNRHDPVSKKWAPGTALSEPLLLEVVGPQQQPDIPPRDQQQADSSGETESSEKEASTGDQAGKSGQGGEGSSGNEPSQEQPGTETGGQKPSESGAAGQDAPGGNQGASEEQSAQQESPQQSGSSSQTSGDTGGQADSSSSQGTAGSQASDSTAGQDAGSQPSSNQTGRPGQEAGTSGNTDSRGNGSGTDSGSNTTGGRGGSDADSQSGTGANGEQMSDAEVIERVQEMIQRAQPDQSGSSSSSSGAERSSSQEQPSQGEQPSSSGQDPASAGGSDSGTQQSGDRSKSKEETAGQQQPGENQSASDPQTSEADNEQAQSSSSSQSADSRSQTEQGQQTPSGDSQAQDASNASESGDSSSSDSSSTDQSSSGSESSSSQSSSNQNSGSGSESSGSNAGEGQSSSGSDQSSSSQSGSSQASDSQASGAQGDQGDQSSEGSQSSGDSSQRDEASAQSDPSGSGSSKSDPSSSEKQQGEGQAGDQESQAASKTGADSSGSGGQSDQPQQSGNGKPPSDRADSQSSESGEQSSSQADSPAQSGSQSQSQQQSSSQTSGGQSKASTGSNQNQGQTTGGGASSAAGGPGGDGPGADAVNQEYAERTTQMVLDYLDRQKDQPDPELLKELNWTENDLREFVQRWNNARDLAASGTDADRQKWQEKLKDLGLRPPTLGPRSGMDINDAFQQMQDSGSRVRYPASLRRQFEAFQKAMGNRASSQ